MKGCCDRLEKLEKLALISTEKARGEITCSELWGSRSQSGRGCLARGSHGGMQLSFTKTKGVVTQRYSIVAKENLGSHFPGCDCLSKREGNMLEKLLLVHVDEGPNLCKFSWGKLFDMHCVFRVIRCRLCQSVVAVTCRFFLALVQRGLALPGGPGSSGCLAIFSFFGS